MEMEMEMEMEIEIERQEGDTIKEYFCLCQTTLISGFVYIIYR